MFRLVFRRSQPALAVLSCLPAVAATHCLAATADTATPSYRVNSATSSTAGTFDANDADGPQPEVHVTAKRWVDAAPPTSAKPGSTNATSMAASTFATRYSQAALDAAGIADLKSLATASPEVNFASVQTVVPVITMRGISSRDVTEVGDPAVVVVTDGFSVNRPYALSETLYDLEGVTVLSGPQGVLIGRNALGGVIDIETAKPTRVLEGNASIDLGNYATRNASVMVNVPINDILQFRVAAISRRHDGYLHNAPQADGDDEDARSARVSVAFTPTPRLHTTFTYQDTKVGGVGPVSLDIPYQYDATGQVLHAAPVLPGDPRTFTYRTAQSLSIRDSVARWNIAYDFPGVTLSYLGGIDWLHYDHDADASPSGAAPVSYQQHEAPTTQNHILRLQSRDAGRLRWQAGVSYISENNGLTSANLSPTANGQYAPTLAFDYGVYTRSYAAFAQARYQLTDRLSLTTGLRLSKDEKRRVGDYYFSSAAAPGLYTYVPDNASGNGSKPAFHLALDYAALPGLTTYARYDTAYKAGGFSSAGDYGPETLKGVEVGARTAWLADRVKAQVSAYRYWYDGQQISQLVPFADGQTGTRIVNAGSTAIYGIDLTLRAHIAAATDVDATLSWLHARFQDFRTVDAAGNSVQLAGNAPPQSPDLTLKVGLEQSWRLPAARIVTRLDAKYQSSQSFTIYNYADDRQRAYVTEDVSLTYLPDRSRMTVMFYVRNLSNRQVFVAAEEYRFDDAYRYAFAAPRTFGVRASYRW